jgi:hypothetical protein
MDLGKILIGIALIMLSAGMFISPTGATVCDHSCTVGCGSTFSHADVPVIPYSPQEREAPAGYPASAGTDTYQRSTP